ncbi:MAG: hypothetical protein OES34_11430 [Nitrosopumilus sp.]|nr:hypothetical protein [Nitrosopumilus sp.]
MEHDFSWVYLLFFFLIPLASMIPRMLRKRRKNQVASQTIQKERKKVQTNHNYSTKSHNMDSTEVSKKMLVLGNLVRDSNTFEKIQKNTTLGNKELDSILGDLEENNMLKVHQKKGLLGIKIELYPTDKGIQKYRTYFER